MPKDTASIVLLLAVVTVTTLVLVAEAMLGLDVFGLVSAALVAAGGLLALLVPRTWTRVVASVLFVLYAATVVMLRVGVGQPPGTDFALALQGNLGVAVIAVAAVGAAACVVMVGQKGATPSP